MDSSTITIKATRGQDMRRISLLQQGLTLEVLHTELSQRFGVAHGSTFTIKWTDEDGDSITIANQSDLTEALISSANNVLRIKLFVKQQEDVLPVSKPTPIENELVKHWGITCDVSNQSPIIGVRFHKRGTDYDLCEAEFNKLSPEEQNLFDRIEQPTKLSTQFSELQRSRKNTQCQMQIRNGKCNFTNCPWEHQGESALKVAEAFAALPTGSVMTFTDPQTCGMCCQVRDIADTRQILCDKCLYGQSYNLVYECNRCHGHQQISHPMWKYQPSPDAFGSASWACQQCKDYTLWRILPSQLPSVPLDEADIKATSEVVPLLKAAVETEAEVEVQSPKSPRTAQDVIVEFGLDQTDLSASMCLEIEEGIAVAEALTAVAAAEAGEAVAKATAEAAEEAKLAEKIVQAAEAAEVDEKAARLMIMGFTNEEVARALETNNGEVERAADWLFENCQNDFVEVTYEPPEPPEPAFQLEWEAIATDLQEMGFDGAAARGMLIKVNGNFKEAVKALVSAERAA